jgi:hypothetical protein
MNAISLRNRVALRSGASALVALLAAIPASPQEFPWVGLSDRKATNYRQEGQGHDAPGGADHFGYSLAAGDFNGDGIDDLAAGAPYDDCDFTVWDCGSVVLRFGLDGFGLSTSAMILRQPGSDLPDGAEESELYGYALAAGDLDGNGYDDLAIGVPGNKFASSTPGERYAAGAVDTHFGWSGGLSDWSIEYAAGRFGLPGHPSYLSRFGAALAFGDFDGDGRDDMAIGAPGDYISCEDGGNCRTGSVLVFGRDAEGNHLGFEMFLGDQGLPDEPESGEQFGHALAAGDFNGDGYDDLAVGVPFEDNIGGVLLVYGSPWSLLYDTAWYIGQLDLGEPAEDNDHFGDALAAGDFNGDGFDDLAMSSAHEDGGEGLPDNSGLVLVAYGSGFGLTTTVTRLWQDDLSSTSHSESFDYFGSALAAGDFNGDGIDDLAVGHEGEDGSVGDSGAVTIVTGTGQGLVGAVRIARPSATPAKWMISDSEVGHPLYGFSLASGDFDGNGFSDLAIGAPNRDSLSQVDSGGFAVLYGNLFSDSFESGSIALWSNFSPR